MLVRRVLIGVAATVLAVAAVLLGVDFGTSIYAEYRLSKTVRNAAGLDWDPAVAILAFPFIPQAVRDHYDELEIKATGVRHPEVGTATLEATMHSIGLARASWLIRPDAPLTIGMLESRIIIGSAQLGRFLGMPDLMVEAPRSDTNDATGGTTESGISTSRGLVFTATPKPVFDHRVSVSVDLSVTDATTLVFTPTGVLTGPDTANQRVPEDKRHAVLAMFDKTLPNQRLPFGLTPTSWGARGSDVIIEGIADDQAITLDGFNPS